ncbi:heparinase II/III family protein [Microbispora sp. RL4-1S]|uniref:Heparinase II/III family protein n=1 Tax=Microbispora oryzae TaxID=2806554 RepID=A0A941AP38_9ACTN|nr:heparinase II/III family protein [Microbispora oryzae]MBP2703304.1 heparinase II/III family protein [Microbispora oryzae]
MRRRTSALGLLAVLLLTELFSAPARAATGPVHTPECQGDWLPATPTSPDVMDGKLSFLGLPAVTVGKNVNWRMDPYKNRSWEMVFQSLRWMGRLVADYESTGKDAYLDRAVEIAHDWVADNPLGGRTTSKYAWAEHPIALRAPALVCLSRHVSADWLTRSLALHAKLLSDPRKYEAGHNHGLDQDIGLLRIGCRYHNKGWQNLALSRMVKSAKLDIDAQGALREQAPRYAMYVYDRLGVAVDTIKDCGRAVPADLATRWRHLPEHISAATQPNGYMVPLGDGPADVQPASFPHSDRTVQVFDGGYVFGRTAWGDAQSAYYSIRFGPGQKFHGHEDHLGVTYYAQGRSILTEAGFHSYENTPYRRWTLTPEAHNVPVIVGRRLRPHTATALTRESIHKDRQTFTLTDRAYGVRRTRSVLVNHHRDVMAVLDTAAAPLRDLWHFDPSLKVVSNAKGTIVVADGDWRATLVQLSPATCAPARGQQVVSGRTGPYQGWISPGYMRKTAAPAVVSPTAKALLTIVVPGTDDPAVTCSGHTVTVHSPGGPVTLHTSASGSLS